jgi:hypothetical protein
MSLSHKSYCDNVNEILTVQCDGADKNSCRGTLFIDVEIINNLLQYFVEVNQVSRLMGVEV